MAVKLFVDIGHFLGVRLKKIRVDELEIICVDLSPAQAGTVLAKIYELGVSGYDRK